MKAAIQTDHRKNRLPHLTYTAFGLWARVRTSGFWKLTVVVRKPNSLGPVKQTRALLESNPPRDNWIDGDEIKNVSTFGEANTSPNEKWQTFISEPEHALKNSSKTVSKYFRDGQTKNIRKNYLSSYPFFRSKPNDEGGRLIGSPVYSGLVRFSPV
jgi:hypothetical protein